MYTRIVVPIDHSHHPETPLAHASEMARLTLTPIHLVGIIDTRQFIHLGPHGPSVDVQSFRRHASAARASVAEELREIEASLSGQGVAVTHEGRQGVPEFELPASLRMGDLVVTSADQCVRLKDEQRHQREFEILALPETVTASTALGW